jgi:hypothetical protein
LRKKFSEFLAGIKALVCCRTDIARKVIHSHGHTSARALIMSPHSSLSLIFVAVLLMIMANAAMAEIVKCTNHAGAVTFRDVPCKAGEDAVRIYGPSGNVLEKDKTLSVMKNQAAAKQVGTTKKIVRPPINYGLGTDVTTLKMAKEALASSDRLSKLTHQQTFASSD